ncbi:MAG: HU family DNA-binding protein [Candidatus Kapabacteria bacterium]|jgi:DNA-binding protein HU-beta|nr:HU family DNA-binding protein [Candidatus Kapabacteria bacterium]
MALNKQQLVSAVSANSGLTKVDAEKAINSTITAISAELASSGSITLIGFGTFSVSNRAARNGKNPQTGATIAIAAKKVAKFKPGKALAESVNIVASAKKAAPAAKAAPKKK